MTDIALDTSAAVALLLRSHAAHEIVRQRVGPRRACLTGHSLAETYSVLTRLPGDARVLPADAALLLDTRFERPCVLPAGTARALPATLASLRMAGGAVYDALVGLAAKEARLPLLTRDRRAEATYLALGIEVEVVAG